MTEVEQKKTVTVEDASAADDFADMPVLEEGAAPGEARGEGEKMTRNEKKTRKLIFSKHKYETVAGIRRVTIKTNRAVFAIHDPDVFLVKEGKVSTYLVFGQIKNEDMAHSRMAETARNLIPPTEQETQKAEPATTTPDLSDIADDAEEDGVSIKSIELVLCQAQGKTREEVKEALRKSNGDIVGAIMELA